MTALGYSSPGPSPAPRSPLGAPPAIDTLLVTLGTGLTGGAALLGSATMRSRGDFALGAFLISLAAVLGLTAIVVAAYVLVRDPARRTLLAAYPGAVGAGAAGVFLLGVTDGSNVAEWLAGLLILALGVAGFALTRAVPYVVASIAGLGIFYTKLVLQILGLGDTSNLQSDVPSHLLLWGSLAVWIFAGGVSVAGWFLPGRHVIAVWMGYGALAGNAMLMVVALAVKELLVAFAQPLLAASSASSLADLSSGGSSSSTPEIFTRLDVALVLVFATLAVAGWGYAYVRSGIAGYRVLILAAGAVLPVVAAGVLLLHHPSIWSLVLLVLGGGLLGAVGAMSLSKAGPGGPGAPAWPGTPPAPYAPFGQPVDERTPVSPAPRPEYGEPPAYGPPPPA